MLKSLANSLLSILSIYYPRSTKTLPKKASMLSGRNWDLSTLKINDCSRLELSRTCCYLLSHRPKKVKLLKSSWRKSSGPRATYLTMSTTKAWPERIEQIHTKRVSLIRAYRLLHCPPLLQNWALITLLASLWSQIPLEIKRTNCSKSSSLSQDLQVCLHIEQMLLHINKVSQTDLDKLTICFNTVLAFKI